MATVLINLLLLPLTLYALFLFRSSDSLRTGAPEFACVNLRPFHGLNSAKPASASQFFLGQSSLTYAPGNNVTVTIGTDSSERYFRGFIVQAYDPISGTQIGHFLANPDSRPIDSCSAATHRNNLNKKLVTLTWLPPVSLVAGNSQSSRWLSVQPTLSYSITQKRQLEGANSTVSNATIATAPELVAETSRGVEKVKLHQVRFRATIVVTYEEFYTGFESSDLQFEKFDYATGKPARK